LNVVERVEDPPRAAQKRLMTSATPCTRIASGLIIPGFIVMQRVITLGRDSRG
jgi:hypothetical protein